MFISFVSVTLEPQTVSKSAVINRPYHTPPPLPPLPPYPSAKLPTFPPSTQKNLILEMSSELPKPVENTEAPLIHYKPVVPLWTQDGLKEHLSLTTESNGRIPIPSDPTPLILQPPTAVHIQKKPLVISQSEKPAVRLTTVKPVTTSTASHFTLSHLTVSESLNPVVTDLNKTAVTKSVNILNIKTMSTASTALNMPTVPIRRNSSLISTALLVPRQSSTTLKTTPLTQNYPRVTQVRSKLVVFSIPPVTKLKQTARTSASTVSPLIIHHFTTVPSETQDVTERLTYSEPITTPPWMTVTRGKEITIIYLNTLFFSH